MKRLFTLVILLFATMSVVAQDTAAKSRADYLVSRLSEKMHSMPSYRVEFEVQAGDDTISGEYSVAGYIYHIAVADMEVYGDDKVRYEIDKSKREIVVDRSDIESHNLLSNPTRAFSFVGSDYQAELLSEDGRQAEIRLTPKDTTQSEGIAIAISLSDYNPLRILYDVEGDCVAISILTLKSDREPARYDSSRYKDYEVIDFR